MLVYTNLTSTTTTNSLHNSSSCPHPSTPIGAQQTTDLSTVQVHPA